MKVPVSASTDILETTLLFHHIHSIRFHHHSGPTSSHANGIHLVWLVRFRDWLEEKPFVEDRSKGFSFFLFFPTPLFCRVRVALLQLLQTQYGSIRNDLKTWFTSAVYFSDQGNHKLFLLLSQKLKWEVPFDVKKCLPFGCFWAMFISYLLSMLRDTHCRMVNTFSHQMDIFSHFSICHNKFFKEFKNKWPWDSSRIVQEIWSEMAMYQKEI